MSLDPRGESQAQGRLHATRPGVHDLLTRVEELRVDLHTAQALVLQDDLRDVEATARRTEEQLAHDFADNPGLRND
jgi:hypothetical protein